MEDQSVGKRLLRPATLAAAACTALFLSDSYRAPAEPAGKPADVLAALNEASRAAYRQGRAEALAAAGPVLLVEGDKLVLVYGIYRSEARFSPDVYHTLKAVSHVPLALFALLNAAADRELSGKRVFDLQRYRTAVTAARDGLDNRGLRAEQLERQGEILKRSLAFLDQVAAAGRVSMKDLKGFTAQLRPLLEANTAEAARAQIDALHRQVTAWRSRFTDAEWEGVTVIVMGRQLPRKDNVAVQYFARLLGERGEGRRIVYAEALFDETQALDLLGAHLIDTEIGAAFFGDRLRMHRDLLADAAREHLDKLFKKSVP
jgi:hypothetical protein